MIEIKYLKDLPCKLLNTSDLISLKGGDIYVDADGYRYIFLGFRNNTKKPVFDIYLEIKQYDGSGTIITSKTFCLPNIYFPHGEYITEEPIKVEKECNGVEIMITFADFGTHVLTEDMFVKKGAEVKSPKYGVIDQKPKLENKVEPIVTEEKEQAEPEITVEAKEEVNTEIEEAEDEGETTEKVEPVSDVVKGRTKVYQIGKNRTLAIIITILLAVVAVGALLWFYSMWIGPLYRDKGEYAANIIEILKQFEF